MCPRPQMGCGVSRYPLIVARPPDLPLSAVTADGATRAARMGAALSEASGDPVRAGGSCRQRNVPGRSVGTAEVSEPLPPSSDVRFRRLLPGAAPVLLSTIRAAARGGASPPGLDASLPLERHPRSWSWHRRLSPARLDALPPLGRYLRSRCRRCPGSSVALTAASQERQGVCESRGPAGSRFPPPVY